MTVRLSDAERRLLESCLGLAFVSALPYLAQTYALHRDSFGKDGNTPVYVATRAKVLASLQSIATAAARGDEAEVRKKLAVAAAVVRGWYLPWHLSRIFGPPDLQGMDPALLDTATPSQIEAAARAAMVDPKLKPGSRGRGENIVDRKLILTVRQAYELHTGKRATVDTRDNPRSPGSRFLECLGIVARVIGWHGRSGAHPLRDHARKLLAADPYVPGRMGAFFTIGTVQREKIQLTPVARRFRS